MTDAIEKLKNNSIPEAITGKGGARPGAGRPKGGENESTKLRRIAKEAFVQRVADAADELFNAQVTLAKGCSFLFRVGKDSKGNNLPAERVKQPSEIIQYLDGEFEDTDSDYYYITTEKPDNRALDSLLDRAFAKAEAKLDITSDGEPLESGATLEAGVLDKFVERLKDATKQA